MIRVLTIVLLFLLAFGANFWAGLKYPDIEPSILGFIATAFYLFSLFFIRHKRLFLFSALCSLLTGVLFAMEFYLVNNTFLDTLSSIRYPLYGLFIMPLFGMNMVFSMPINTFAFLCAGIYLTIYIFRFVRMISSRKV